MRTSRRNDAARHVTRLLAAITRGCGFAMILFLPMLCAQETTDQLRDLARNPVADAIKVPFVQDINFDTGLYGRVSNSLQLQPVIPFQVSKNWLLVLRIVATAVDYEPDVAQTRGGTIGSGDMATTFFFTPFRAGKLIWGVGPSLLIPTATDSKLGTGKWSLGPSVALLAEPNWGSAGVLMQNIWSLREHSSRPSVNQTQIETSASYNLPRGWYLATAPTVTADWTQAAGKRWLVPSGGGAGRTFNIRTQGVDSNITLYYSAVRPPGQLFPKWQLSLQFSLIYSNKHKAQPKEHQVSQVDSRYEMN